MPIICYMCFKVADWLDAFAMFLWEVQDESQKLLDEWTKRYGSK